MSLDVSGTATPQQYLRGDAGYFTQEMYVVTIPDKNLTSTTPSIAVFTGDTNPNSNNDSDVSGIGLGTYSIRFDNEIISYVIGSTNSIITTPVAERGFGVAETSTAKSYIAKNVGFINARNNVALAPTTQELSYNGLSIANTTVGLPQFKNFSSRYWIGRNQDYKAGYNGNIAEVITYDIRKNDASERNRIESYLGIKYGITLGTNGTSQNYVNSDGNIIWNSTTNNGFNWNIAGIGRDDVSKLTQKQSRSSNSATEVTIGLGEVAATNTANTNTFTTNKQFLVWGSNDLALSQNGSVAKSVTLGSGVTTTFFEANRKYKIVETGGDVAQTVVSLPKSSLISTFPKSATQEYVLIVSSTNAFANADIIDIIPLADTGSNFETWYDFDGTKFFSFGIADMSTPKYRIENGSGDFIVGEKNINLSNTFTVSAWIRATANNGTFIAKSGAYRFYVNSSDKFVGNWNNGDRIVSTGSITTGTAAKWHYVTVSFASGIANIYVDGVLNGTATGQPNPIPNTSNFSIGAIYASKDPDITNPFSGDIDEVRIWNSALNVDQIRFIMNQEILKNSTNTFGSAIPSTITKNDISTLLWSNLQAYYNMNTLYGTSIKDLSDNNRWARIKYLVADNVMIENQTAPLPYVSIANGAWQNTDTWSNGSVQTIANSPSTVDPATIVDWNIVQTQNAVSSNGNKTLLGLIVSSNTLSAINDTKVEVSHYLSLNGKIDLVGESQLIQTLNSDLDPTSSGSLEKDQQGTKVIYNYNFWCSPVGAINSTTNNNSHTVNGVFKDGTTATPANINWVAGYDGSPTSPISLASYWIFKFQNASANYSNWMSVGPNGTLTTAQGFTLKGSGSSLADQNYTFLGKPNNGRVQFSIGGNLINLTGNPYSSALDAQAFINANLASTDGTLYFWDHFGGGTHVLLDYQGGYATYNNLGGVVAMSHPQLQNVGPGTKQPKRYVPVGQGFFIRSSAAGGNVAFNNDQRFFVKKGIGNSVMFKNNNQTSSVVIDDHFTNNSEDEQPEEEQLMKIRLGYRTKDDFKRQVLLGFANEKATEGIDAGYDAIHIDDQINDMYFLHGETKLIIQGDGFFNPLNVYPIGVKSTGAGNIKFLIDQLENFAESQEIYIYDSLTETYHDIKAEEFQISLPGGIFNDRFSLRFANDQNLGGQNPALSNDIQVAFTSKDNILHIKNKLIDTQVISATVFNIIGQKLNTYDIENQNQQFIQIPISNLSTGTYIVKIQTTKGNLSQKIIIK